MTSAGPGVPGIHDWPGTRAAFAIAPGPGGPLLALTIAIEARHGSAASQFADLYALFGEPGQEDHAPLVVASCDTHGTLAAAALTHDAYGVPLSERLASFIGEVCDWLDRDELSGTPPALTVYFPISSTAPQSWTADLQRLEVTVTLAGDTAAVGSSVPAGEDPSFASSLEKAFHDFDAHGTRVKAARGTGSREGEVWLLRWGGPGATRVSFPRDTEPLVLLIPPLSATPITRDVDGARFTDVDLDVFAAEFLTTLDGMAPRTEAVAEVRRDLSAAIAATAVPAWRTPGDALTVPAAAGGIERMLEQDLTLAVHTASIAHLEASVDGHMASGSQAGLRWRLIGAIVDTGEHVVATGGVLLSDGAPAIELMLVPADAGAVASIALDPIFRAGGIDAIGAAPLRFPIPESIALGPLTMPVPLRTLPPSLSIRRVSASQDDTAASDGFAPPWCYALTIDTPGVAQDAVAVVVSFDEAVSETERTRPAGTAPPQAALFDAIVRFMNAHRSGDPGVVERARDVAGAWKAWAADAAPEPVAIDAGALAFRIGRDADGTALLIEATDAPGGPPIWPALDGYTFEPPAPGTRRARFVPASAAPRDAMTLTFGPLDVRRTRRARAWSWIERNRAGMPEGDEVDPRFVRRGPVIGVDAVAPPTLRNRAPIVLPRSSSLLVSLEDLVAAIASPGGAEMTIVYTYSTVPGFKVRVPVLMLPRRAAISGADVAAELGRALAAWAEQVSPGGADGAFEFDIKVWPEGDEDVRTGPLFWFTDVRLDVSDAPEWWDSGAGRPPATRV